MPVKTDGLGRRWVEVEFLVPGTPEQVWQAIATGPGSSAWFTPTTVEERVGGAIAFDFGNDQITRGTVTAWEPPSLFGYEERDWLRDAPPVATEITVTGRAGGQCVVRIVHRLFTSRDDWDNEIEGFTTGWPPYFDVLCIYLTQFPDEPAASFKAAALSPGGDLKAWSLMTEALNLASADVGERREAPAGGPRLAGTIEQVQEGHNGRHMMLRLDAPNPGIALIDTYTWDQAARAVISFYFYGLDAERSANAVKDQWASWIRGLLEGTTA
jgi:uncharacterized protein YndB with AHSA1/START domain